MNKELDKAHGKGSRYVPLLNMKKYALQSDGMPVNRLSVATRIMEGHLYLEFLDWFFPLQIGNLE